MRLASLAALALFSSVALVGCGDGSGGDISISKQDATTTTAADDSGDSGDSGATGSDRDALITYIGGTSNDMLSGDAGDCVADATLDDLSADGLDTVRAGGDFDLTAFSSTDSDLIVTALDQCVDLDEALKGFADGITSDASLPLSDDEAACAAAEFGKTYKGAGEFIAAASAMSDEESGTKLLESLGPCITDESAVAFLSSILGEEGMTQEVAACLSQGIIDQLGAAGALDAISNASNGDSSTLENASVAAAGNCDTENNGSGDPTVSIPPIGGGLSGN